MKEEILKLNKKDYVAVAVGHMSTNLGNVAKSTETNGPIGKAVIVDHYLFDQLWMSGSCKIPDRC